MTTVIITLCMLAALGLGLVAVGWRGRRVNDRPICRKCGFDLTGLSAVWPKGTQAPCCTECGRVIKSSRSFRIGERKRRPIVMMLGVVTLLSAGGGTALAMGTVERMPRTPLTVLRVELDFGKMDRRARALREIIRRIESGAIHDENGRAALRPIVRRALARQADDTKPWGYLWGDFMEVAQFHGLLHDEDWDRYLAQAVRLTLIPRSPLRAGDPIAFMIDQELRVGVRGQTWMWLRCSIPVLGDQEPVFPNDSHEDPNWPGVQLVQFARRLQPQAPGWNPWRVRPRESQKRPLGLLPPESISRPELTQEPEPIAWPVAPAPGTDRVRVLVEVSLFDWVDVDTWNFDVPGRVPGGAMHRRIVELVAPISVVSRDEAPITVVTDETLKSAYEQAVFASVNEGWRSGDLVALFVRCSPVPVPIAAEVFAVHGSREWSLGFRSSSGHRAAWCDLQTPRSISRPRPKRRTRTDAHPEAKRRRGEAHGKPVGVLRI